MIRLTHGEVFTIIKALEAAMEDLELADECDDFFSNSGAYDECGHSVAILKAACETSSRYEDMISDATHSNSGLSSDSGHSDESPSGRW